MAIPSWPLTSRVQKNFTETSGVSVLRTPMDSGVAKQRRRSFRPDTLSVAYLLTTEEVSILSNFVQNTLGGTKRFSWTHPRTQQLCEVRILPQGDGQLYTLSYAAPGYFNVNLNIEVLP